MRSILGLGSLVGLGLALWLYALGVIAPAAALPPSPDRGNNEPASSLDVQPLFLSARLLMGATEVYTLSVGNLDAHLPLTYSIYVLPNARLNGIVPWLEVSPTWGRLPPGGRATVQVTFQADESTVLAAVNMATLWILGEGFTQPLTVTVPVVLEVHPLQVQPGNLWATMRAGWQASLPLTVTNAFPPPLDFDLGVAGGTPPAPWLSGSPVSGTLAGGQSRRLTVDLDGGGLAPGVYRGDLLLGSDLAPDWTLTVPVTLSVQPWPIYLPLLACPGAAGTHCAVRRENMAGTEPLDDCLSCHDVIAGHLKEER